MPVLVARVGPRAEERFATFFTDNIRNPNTRRAYHRAATQFFHWCASHGLEFTTIRSFHVSAYIEELLAAGLAKASVKQSLASIRMLYDWLIVGQVVELNPAQAVRGPRLVVKTGKTPVLDSEQMAVLINSIDTSAVVGLRDRALIATMVYTFGRVGAIVNMRVEDYYPNGKRWWVRLHEKGGKHHEVTAHHKREEYLDQYVHTAGIREHPNSFLFRSALRRTGDLTDRAVRQADVWRMLRRRAIAAGIATPISCHTFRATGITNFMQHGGTLERAQKLAAHESPRTTSLYDRSQDEFTLEEIERIRF